jgi:hypothetical protein
LVAATMSAVDVIGSEGHDAAYVDEGMVAKRLHFGQLLHNRCSRQDFHATVGSGVSA